MTDTKTPQTHGLDLTAVGRATEPQERTWSAKDAMLYAVGVGAGLEDAVTELALTTENSTDTELCVLPTFAVLLGLQGLPPLGRVKLSQILHGDQSITMHRPLPTDGHARSVTTITGIYDKGSGALVTVRSEVVDAETEEPLATADAGIFVRGEGGFGGDRGPSSDWTAPEREPDRVVSYTTAPGQALLYRLSGDNNPLHSDPVAATAVGFPRPILHGLCTYGYAGRALLSALCDGDVGRFGSLSARFSTPVLPGQRLDTAIWENDAGALFQTSTPEGGVALDHGRFRFAAS